MSSYKRYRYAFGAADPVSGDSFFLIMPECNTVCTNIFLKELSKEYSDDIILLVCDNAAWHKSKNLKIPENIEITHIPPYTPEMNPMEQIWQELRRSGFKNESFNALNDVVDRLCDTICSLTNDVTKSITERDWIIEMFQM